MNNEEVKSAIIEKFGEPDYIQVFNSGNLIENILYINPIKEEELYDTGIITVGLSSSLLKDCDKMEFILNILVNNEKDNWMKFGEKLQDFLNNFLIKNKCIKRNDINFNFSIPLFESMSDVCFVDYGFLSPSFLFHYLLKYLV